MPSGDDPPALTPSSGGIAAEHSAGGQWSLPVATSTEAQFNSIRLPLVSIGCWRVDDLRFSFNSSFVGADSAATTETPEDIRAELANLALLVAANPGCPLTVFGHADPTGSDNYNKALSGRRAKSIYALLLFNTDPDTAVGLWHQVASAEKWGAPQRQAMQDFTGQAASTDDSSLIRAYMAKLCEPAPKLTKADFLAQGADSAGKGDYQGCSEFNPVLLFSQEDQDRYTQAKQQNDAAGIAARDAANARNRRVMVLLFKKGSQVDPQKWPCPSADGGTGGCIARFWSDGNDRRSKLLSGVQRSFYATQDTFACRFYQRISNNSPCEQQNTTFQLQLRDFLQNPLPGYAYSLTVNDKTSNFTTDDSGFTKKHASPPGKCILTVRGHKYELSFADEIPLDMMHAQSMLNGLGFNAGKTDGILGRRTKDALKSFQYRQGLPQTGTLDDDTVKALRSQQLIGDKLGDGPDKAPPEVDGSASKFKDNTLAFSSTSGPQPTDAGPISGSPAGTVGDAPADIPPKSIVLPADAGARIDVEPPHNDFSRPLAQYFDAIDKDKDGFLSKEELNKAIELADTYFGLDAVALATLKVVFGDFEDFSDDEVGIENDGVTRADITAYDRARLATPNNLTILSIAISFKWAADKVLNRASALFTGSWLNVTAIQQSTIGDCWFLAAVVGLGINRPDEIKAMLSEVSNGFLVKFPNDSNIFVAPPTDAEIGLLSVSESGLWLPVLQIAAGIASNGDLLSLVGTSRFDNADRGGGTGKGIEMLTGGSDMDILILTSLSTTRKKLKAALDAKRVVVCGTRGTLPTESNDRPNGLPMGHAYTVFKYDETTDLIIFRNPWGNVGKFNGTDLKNGFMEMGLVDFCQNMSDIAYEDHS